ncbi:hypothetical protein [Alcaligenes endophyticus]|uniref:Uncharacterized protein n=1 Tax=Alcaligenes endophyticus TaxID=1929088 RepID=A0ABT8ENS7_9BURK|nr:hypothetical protein [Alcaligenes endophyticus]MCX5592810.1 hypothetical protein [Alcaligenes endophyticus]MDN4122852.1 hypothetical protein [Alcaligenes endophyticus]
MKNRLKILLGEWGRWKRTENRTGLGYPSRSAFHQERVDGSRYYEASAPLVDDELRQLDDAIGSLYPDYQAILRVEYIAPGVTKVKADRMKISVRIYYTNLEHAHKNLAQAMGSRYQIGFESKLCAHVDLVCAQI